MKTTKLLSILALVISAFSFSCSSNEEDPEPLKSIKLTADKSSFNQGETITFTVKTNTKTNITSKSVIKVNGAKITGNTYTPTTSGIFKAKATYQSLTSDEISFTVNKITPNATVTSVVIKADKTSVKAGNLITFTSKVTYSDNSEQDKTSETVFSIEGTEIKGNKHIGFNIGKMTVKGTFSSVTSNEVSVQVNQIATPSTFTKKAVIEDYTGTWCGWCPRVAYAIDLVKAQSNKVFAVAAHLANGDPMENKYSITLAKAFGINSLPTAYVNREAEWTSPEPNNIAQTTDAATGSTDLGLAINSTLSDKTMQIVVSTGFAQNVPGTKLVVFILEDDISRNQSNYTSYYGGANILANFKHNHVLRYATTSVLGDPITTNTGVSHTSYTINLSSANIADKSKTSIIAMLVDSTGKKVLNAQYSKVNIDKEFD